MQDGKCSKNFPKPFCDQTTISEDPYAACQRKDDGIKHDVQGAELDNCWIVPYCAWLIYHYQCHINLELVFSMKSIKYIYKYIYKGYDCTIMQFGRVQDEIQVYLDTCYVCACEGFWHLVQFGTHEEFPPVYPLQIHLPGEQQVTWNPDLQPNLQEVMQQAARRDSMLIAYFKANQVNAAAHNYLYQDFPQHFVWKDRERIWKPRQQNFAIGRMYYVHPTAGEHFYLCLLLTVVKGATSYQDLLAVDGVAQATFKQACIAWAFWRTIMSGFNVFRKLVPCKLVPSSTISSSPFSKTAV
jgi:hypothetical protein